MNKKYIATIKKSSYNDEFIKYLTQNNISYQFLEGLNFYIIETTSNNYNKIKNLDYIDLIVENFNIKVTFDESYQNLKYKNWGIKKIKAPCMWNRGFTGKGINIALLDTGVNPNPNFKLAGSISFIPKEGPEDKVGHGTKMAGIIASNNFKDEVVGVAWECNLYNVKAFGSGSGTSDFEALIRSLDWCAKNSINVICLALSIQTEDGEPFPQLEEKILIGAMSQLKQKGVIVASSTGNNGKNSINYPGAISYYCNNILPVGAVNDKDKRIPESNYGPNIFCVAPGDDIYTTTASGGYALVSGTSPATAFLAGFVALLLSQDKSRTIEQIKEIIIDNAFGFGTDIDLGKPGYDLEYGYGRINAPLQAYSILLEPTKSVYKCEEEVIINLQLLDKYGEESNESLELLVSIITPSKKVIDTKTQTDKYGKATILISSSCSLQNNKLVINEIGEYIVNIKFNEGECTSKITYSTKFELINPNFKEKTNISNSYKEADLPASKVIVAILNTNKGYYNLNETGVIEITTKDENGNIVKNVDINLSINYPNEYKKCIKGTTGCNGKLCVPFLTYKNCICNCGCNLYLNLLGEYKLDLKASKKSYESNQTSIMFYVQEGKRGYYKYYVALSDLSYKNIFERYLIKCNIKYSLLKEINIYSIECDESNIKYIKTLEYIKYTCKDCIIPNDKIENQYSQPINKSSNYQSLDYSNQMYRNWGISKIKAPCLWDKGIIGSGIKVALIDSGVYPHRDLKVVENISFIPGQSPIDEIGHGTAVAGVICAKNFTDRVVGVAWDCDLYNLKVLSKDGSPADSLVKALTWCLKNKMDVVNISLVSAEINYELKQALTDIIIKLGENNIIVVASTGNEGKPTINYPSIVKPAIAVGASDIDDKVIPESNYGVGINYVAPGKEIYTTYLYNGYKTLSGTSIATPFVTGLIALMLSDDYILNQSEIEAILNRNIVDLGKNGYDLKYGYGRINAPLDTINIVINPSKKIYECDDFGEIIFTAISSRGENVKGINIDITIQTPDDKIISSKGKTECGGIYILDFTIDCNEEESQTNFNQPGIYKINAQFEPNTCYPALTYKSEFSILQ